jgi:GT2 family glycosyltransferase
MPLSIIIVNYYSTELIRQCLNSLNIAYCGSITEVLIVDNSSDATGRMDILKSFPDVQWIDMGYNAGFARANNAGMKAAKGDAFLLLNPDTLAIDDSIERCYQKLKKSRYIAAGVQLLDALKVPQISGSFFVVGGLNHLLPIPYWGNFIRWLGYSIKTKVPNIQQAKEVEEADWITGAFLMVKREAVESAGFMDENFFLYAEEVEWCSRLKKAGPLCIFGNLRMIHLEGTTINKSQNLDEKGYYNLYDKKGLQLMVSNHLRVRKQYGIKWFLFLLLNYSLGVFVFFVAGTLHDIIRFKNPAAQWKKAAAFARNVTRLWILSPTIIRNKPYFYKML